MALKTFSLIGLGMGLTAVQSMAATVAQMSGTVFTAQQHAEAAPAGISQPLALALFGGVALVFMMMSRRRSA